MIAGNWLLSIGESAIRVSTPLVFAALGGLLCERAGVVNIALEGIMLLGAFFAAAVTYTSSSPWLGLGAAMLAGVLFAAIHGVLSIELAANQIISGVAINLLAVGLTPFLCKIIFDSTAGTPTIPIAARFQYTLPVLAVLLLVLCNWWLKFTPSGTWLRFAGEHPDALESVGLSVRAVRWSAVLASGLLGGIGGASLSIFLSSSFSRNMTAGRGFMALAAVIFGKWRPLPTVIACLLFGLFDALQMRLQGVILFGSDPVPVQFIQILPYLATILVLAGIVGQSRAPRALGLPLRTLMTLLGVIPGIMIVTSGCKIVIDDSKVVVENGKIKEEPPENSKVTTKPNEPVVSKSAVKNRTNAEMLSEIYTVVYNVPPRDRYEFANLLNALNQGASLEGIYNGFVHSSRYLELEKSSPPAAEKGFKTFFELLGNLESALFIKTKFEETFQGVSVFALKRILGDEALKVIYEKKVSHEKLCHWYANWAFRMTSKNVNFGIVLRNKPDETFHYSWAIKATDDQLTWEVLNRIHRMMN